MAETADDLVKLYNDRYITQDVDEVPYKLLKIRVKRLERLEAVIQDIEDLNDLSTNTGVTLDLEADKWSVVRQGKSDSEMLEAIADQVLIFTSGSTLPDFIAALAAFDAPVGSKVVENLPPEFAELNILLNNADVDTLARITKVVNIIKAGGVQVEIYNELITGFRLLQENGFALTQENGDFLLLE